MLSTFSHAASARRLAALVLIVSAGAATWSFAQPTAPKPAAVPHAMQAEDADEETIDFAKAPEAVRTAALKLVGSGGEKAIKKTEKEEEDGRATYEIEYAVDGVDCSAVFSSAGDLMESEKGVKESAIPAAALAALRKAYPGATLKEPSMVQKTYYEVDIVIDGKSHEVKVDAAGEIKDKSKSGGHDEHKDDKKD